MRADRKKENRCSNACPHDTMKDTKKTCGFCALQTVDKKLFSPRRGRIALSANERIAEFLDFAIQAKFAYVNKLRQGGIRRPPEIIIHTVIEQKANSAQNAGAQCV